MFRHPNLLSVHFLKSTAMDISSTQIRHLTVMDKSIRYLVPDAVMGYIYEKQLYKMEEEMSARATCGSAGGGHDDSASR